MRLLPELAETIAAPDTGYLLLAALVAALVALGVLVATLVWMLLATELRRPKDWRLLALLESTNVCIGRLMGWVLLGMVLTQCLLVIMRYVFSLGSLGLQESVWYMHALILTLGVGYTLACDEHVRLDIFYSGCTPVRKAWINLLGIVFGLIPFCTVTLWFGWRFVERSWRLEEGSAEVSGLPWIYAIKTAILIFAVLLLLQGVVLAARSLVTIRGNDTNALP